MRVLFALFLGLMLIVAGLRGNPGELIAALVDTGDLNLIGGGS